MRDPIALEIARCLVPKTYRAVPRFNPEERAALERWQAKLDLCRNRKAIKAAVEKGTK